MTHTLSGKTRIFLLFFFVSIFFIQGCMSTKYIVAVRMEPKTPDVQVFIDGKMVGKTNENGFAQIESEEMSIFKNPLLEVKNDEYYGFLKLDYVGNPELGHNVKTSLVKNVEMDRFYEVIFLYPVTDPGMEKNLNAELKIDKSNVCELLVDLGYPTKGWRRYYDDDYGCTSPSKLIGSHCDLGVVKNNLAYIVSGNATKILELMLVVNIYYDCPLPQDAHEELLRTAALLVKKSFNRPLPENIREAMIKGDNASTRIGDANIRVVRNNWTTGKGYDIKVKINY